MSKFPQIYFKNNVSVIHIAAAINLKHQINFGHTVGLCRSLVTYNFLIDAC